MYLHKIPKNDNKIDLKDNGVDIQDSYTLIVK